MKAPLVAPLLAVVFGILIAQRIVFQPLDILVGLVLLTLLAVLASKRARRIKLPSALIALAFGGMLTETIHRPGNPPRIEANSRETVLLSGCVVEPSAFYEGRDQFTVELAPQARARVSLTIRDGDPAPSQLSYGQPVEFDARVRAIRNFENPGAFDYRSYEARRHVYWTASVSSGSPVQRLPGRCGSRAAAMIYALRTAALARIDRLYAGDPYATGIMEATLIGETSKLEKIWTDHFRRTGTYHMLVIDGLHITVLAAFVLFLLRLGCVPELAALATTAAGAWIYALASGFHAPAVRAAGGFGIYVVCRFFYRRRSLLNLLAAVALLYLCLDPDQLFEAGFQLSFLSVAAIATLAVPLLDRTSATYSRSLLDISESSRDPRLAPRAAQFRLELRLLAETLTGYLRLRQTWLLRGLAFFARVALYVFEMAVISTAIQIGLAVPMAIYFHRIPLSGFSANVVVVPLLALVVPIGFLAVFTGWSAFAIVAEGLLRAGERVAAWHLRVEPDWRVADPPFWLAVGFSVALIALGWSLIHTRRWTTSAGVTVAALFAVLFWHPFPPDVRRGELALSVIDVGQGDSLLVCFPDGKLMLVDGGGILTFGRQAKPKIDIGEDVVSPYLWSRSIRKLDVVALTHAHDDHARGLPAIIENFHPAQLWTGATPPSPVWTDIQQKAAATRVNIVPMSSGRILEFGGTTIEVLSPPADYVAGASPRNNDSLALRITYGSRSFLLTGDMEKPMEFGALASGENLRADVLKVGHHGSNTSSTDSFLDAVAPVYALISDGFENSFRHPHPEVLGRLAAHHAAIYRTDLEGLITVRTDGRRLSIETSSAFTRP